MSHKEMNDKKLKMPGRDILGYFLSGVSLILLLKSMMLCFSSDIWYDELFTVGMIEHSYGDLIAFTARDVHPPLYYCIVKFIVDLCKLISAQANPVVIAKIVSVLPFLILALYSMALIRRRFGILTGGLFLFSIVTMPQLSSYTVEVRMYGWALLFVTAAFLHAYAIASGTTGKDGAVVSTGIGTDTGILHGTGHKAGAYTRHRHVLGLVLYGLAAAYTQYFACVAVAMVYLYVLVVFMVKDRGRIKEWLLWVAISVIAYVPWLFALYGQITAVRESYWILPLTWRSLGGCVKFLMKPAFTSGTISTILAVVLFAVYVSVVLLEIIKLYHYSRDRYKKHGKTEIYNKNTCQGESIEHAIYVLAGVGVLGGVVLFGFAASMLLRPVFVYRYMIPAMGCFWLSFAVGVSEIWNADRGCIRIVKNKEELCKLRLFDLAIVRIVCPAIIGLVLVVGLRDYRAFMGEEEYKIVQMKETQKALSSIAPRDIVLYNFDQVQAVVSYYLDEGIGSYLWCGTPETLIQDIVRPYGTVETSQEIKKWCEDGKNVWFAGSFNSRDELVGTWEKDGFQVEELGSYLLERYWFNLYKISLERQ